MGRPQDACGREDPRIGRGCRLGQARRHGPGPRAIPADRGRERARRGIVLDEPVEVRLRELEGRAGPVAPEVPQVRAHCPGVAVHELLGELELVERLVPELALGFGAQHAADHELVDRAVAFVGEVEHP